MRSGSNSRKPSFDALDPWPVNEHKRSHRDILKATAILGGGTAGGLIIGVVRMKLLAALLGAAGIGLLGVFSTLLTLGVSVAGMAIETTGVRQLSVAAADDEKQRAARWALWSFAAGLMVVALAAFWFLRKPLAALAIGDPAYAGWIPWIGVGVAVSILAAVQLAIVQSDRRLGDFTRIKLVSAIVSLIVGVGAVYMLGTPGVLVAVVAVPISNSLVALGYRANLPRIDRGPRPRFSALSVQWRLLATLGIVVTVSAVIGSIGQLFGRAMIVKELGLEQAGLFQAAFAISSLNVALLLAAMIPDFYPRLSAAVDDDRQFNRILNEQVHVGLIVAAPALTLLALIAPLALQLLYTSEFRDAGLLLRLLIIGDSMRVLGWALGFALLARKLSWSYLVVEATFTLALVPLIWLLMPVTGLRGVGLAYILAYSVTLPASLFLTARNAGIRVERRNAIMLAGLVAILASIAAMSLFSDVATIVLGMFCVAGLAILSVRELKRVGADFMPEKVQRLLVKLRR